MIWWFSSLSPSLSGPELVPYSAWVALHRVIMNDGGYSMHGGPFSEDPFIAQISLIGCTGSITGAGGRPSVIHIS